VHHGDDKQDQSILIQVSAVATPIVTVNFQAIHNNHSSSFVVRVVGLLLPNVRTVRSVKMHMSTTGRKEREFQRRHQRVCVPASNRTEPGTTINIIADVSDGIKYDGSNTERGPAH